MALRYPGATGLHTATTRRRCFHTGTACGHFLAAAVATQITLVDSVVSGLIHIGEGPVVVVSMNHWQGYPWPACNAYESDSWRIRCGTTSKVDTRLNDTQIPQAPLAGTGIGQGERLALTKAERYGDNAVERLHRAQRSRFRIFQNSRR